MSFGERLRSLRRNHDLTQTGLGAAAGCSVNTVRKLESDERKPSRELAARLASVFDLAQHDRADFLRLARGTPHLGRTSLLAPMTRLIGRESELSAIRDRLLSPAVRLLTLVGPPGVGKTRLALQVATDMQAAFRDGAAFVALAQIHEPALVVDSIAHALGLQSAASRARDNVLVEHLRERQLLLVLDNFEQVLPAGESVARLLSEAARLTVLVTSREALDIYGEHVYAVSTLGLPPPVHNQVALDSVNTSVRRSAAAGRRPSAVSSASETLFLERARAVRHNFARNSATDLSVVADICRRLEGLPLALELAASRTRSMTPSVMLAELTRRLDLLSAGPSNFAPRQRSMRGALDWSYALLSESERRLFERLAVFSGGAALEAIVAVCGEPGQSSADVRDVVTSLIDQSLLSLVETETTPRFTMLEVIREYATEQLLKSHGPNELRGVHRRQAEFYAALVDEAPAGLRGSDQVTWLECLELDHGNMRTALEWSLHNHEPTLTGRLTAGLWPFWRARGYFHEGRRWLSEALSLGVEVPPTIRADLLNGAGVLAILQADYQTATTLLEDALSGYRDLGDQHGAAFALNNLGWAAYDRADVEPAEEFFVESLSIRRALGDAWGEAMSINNLGMIAVTRDVPNQAAALFAQSATLLGKVGDSIGMAQALSNQGWAVHLLGDYAGASKLFQASLALAERFQDARRVADNLANLALMALYRADNATALDLFSDALTLFNQLDDKRGMAESLEGLAAVAAVQGRAHDGARLFGLAAQLRESSGAPLLGGDRARYDSAVTAAREQLDDGEWSRAWEGGRMASFQEEITRLVE